MSQVPPVYPSSGTPQIIPPPYPVPGALAVPGGIVPSDMPCRKCGYNLRGLTLDTRCPECGTPVGLSIHGDLLRFSDPQWVRKLQRGAWTIIIGIIVMFFGGIAIGVLAAALPNSKMLVQVFSMIGQLVLVWGAWQITEPDPSGIGEDKYGTARKIIRFALIVGVGNSVLNFIAQVGTFPPEAAMILVVVGGIAGLVGLVGQIAQLNYLSKIALRIPDESLSARARFLMYAIAISYGFLILVGIVMGVMIGFRGAGRAGGGIVAIGCAAGIAGIALLIFAIMYLLMLERMAKRFGQEAVAAEATWAGAAQP